MPLISESYRQQQKTLHDGGEYGKAGGFYAPVIAEIVNRLEITHLLDYGCGSRLSLAEGLKKSGVAHKLKYQAYDPCVPQYAGPPVPAEFVCCVDVLEHIEPDSIDEVLDHLQSLTEGVGFFSIDTGPAFKKLPDGRNAHILQRPPEWWLPRIMERFELQTFQVSQKMQHGIAFFVIVNALPGVIEAVDGGKVDTDIRRV